MDSRRADFVDAGLGNDTVASADLGGQNLLESGLLGDLFNTLEVLQQSQVGDALEKRTKLVVVGWESYLYGLDLEFESGIFVDDNHGVRVQLQAGQSPHVIDTLLNASLQSKRLALAKNNDNDFASLENSLDTDSQGHARDLVDVIAEESRVGENSVVSQSLDTSSAGQAGSRLVESNVAVLANAGKEEINAADGLNGVFVSDALGLEVGGIAVQDVNIGRVDIDVREEVLPHEGVVGFGVVAGNPHVLVHVEGDDMLKGNLRVVLVAIASQPTAKKDSQA